MRALFQFLDKPMGLVLNWFCQLFGGNFAIALLVFTVAINIVFLPLNVKQQKGAAGQARMKNKMEKIKEKYFESDRERYNEEMSKLYQETGNSAMSGCLLLLVRMPFFIAIYNVIRSPFTLMFGVDSKVVEAAQKIIAHASDIKDAATVSEHTILANMDKLAGGQFDSLREAASQIDLSFFGIDLTATPEFSKGVSWLWVIPLLSFATSMLSALISSAMQKVNNPGAPSAMGMMLTMPIISLIIAFTVPGAVGLYWAYSNFVSMIIMTFMQYAFAPHRTIAKLEAKEMRARRQVEQARMAQIDNE